MSTLILPSPSAPEGLVKTLPTWDAKTTGLEDVILCRNVAPLIGISFRLAARETPSSFLGRDGAAPMISFVKRLKSKTVSQLESAIDSYYEQEYQVLLAFERWQQIEILEDKVESLRMFVAGAQTISEVTDRITKFFSPKEGCLTLCTIHRSKGLEWSNVFILDAQKLMPSKFAKTPIQRRQERNLHYVAVTRAKLNLYYISSESLTTNQNET